MLLLVVISNHMGPMYIETLYISVIMLLYVFFVMLRVWYLGSDQNVYDFRFPTTIQ